MSADQLRVAMPAPPVQLLTLSGRTFDVPRPGAWIHLSFLRYASCPMCNLRVRELTARSDDLRKADVEWFAIFHSPESRLRRHMRSETWEHIVADPEWRLGRAYATTRSWLGLSLSMILPSFYWAFLKTLAFGYWGGAIDRWFHSMPADFLVAPDGTIRLARYGRHIGDHAGVDEIIEKRAAAGPSS